MKLGRILLAMVDQPAQAMEGVITRPKSWWLPALLIIFSLALSTYVTAPLQVELANVRQAEVIEQLVASMTDEQAELVRKRTVDMTVQRLLLSAVLLGGLVMAIGWLVRAGIIHLSSMAAGGQSVWAATFAVSVWAMLPDVLRNIVQMLCTVVNGRCIEYQGLGFVVSSGNWLQDSQSMVFTLFESVDPFVVWHLILLSIGIAVATKLSKAKSAIMALGVWVVLTSFRLIPVAISAAVGAQF